MAALLAQVGHLPRIRSALLGIALVGALGQLGPSAPDVTATLPVPSGAPAARSGTAGADVPSGVRAAVDALLERRAAAWRAADPRAWRTTVDEGAVGGQVELFEALGRLPLDAWSEELTALEPSGPTSWHASVVVRYRLAGDDADALVRGVLDVTPELRVRSATFTPVPPWEINDVASATGEHSIVVGGADPELLRQYAAELDGAARSVGLLVGGPASRMVLILADDWQQARRMVPGGAGAGLAALTTPLEPPGMPAGPVRVLADPHLLATLDAPTRIALLGHEAFHVATRAMGPVPLWLSEGLADYAGYRCAGVPVETAVAGLLRQVRSDGPPVALPDDDAFADPARVTQAYEGAHLAVRLLAAAHGDQQVLELYRRVAQDGPQSLDHALEDVLGTDLATVTFRWRAEVAALAGY
jgi:hypothetical protein